LSEDKVVALKPANLGHEQAAAVPFGGLSSLFFLRQASIQRGQRVLIYGASGSLGTYAVQLAKHLGAEVTGVCSTANLDLVRSLGADRTIDYRKQDFTVGGECYDVIFDTVGKTSVFRSLRALSEGGTYLHAVAAPGVTAMMRMAASASKKRMVGGNARPRAEDLVFLKGLIEEGRIRPVIDRIYPLERIVEAHRYVDTGRKRGNVVITVDHAE
jgi:NADPH:quinone reductase-like Zn-dependent oxidoreductase